MIDTQRIQEIVMLEKKRKWAVEYAKTWIGTIYLWSGSDSFGMDCSGLIHEVLQSVGLEPHKFDSTANDLYIKYKPYKIDYLKEGCLVFWFKGNEAKHVEMAINPYQTIGASGGGSPSMSVDKLSKEHPILALLPTWILKWLIGVYDAMNRDAFVKIRPVDYRGPGYKIVDPFLNTDTPGDPS
ncbi:C40 family peptidase [Patescibacteria group bacterium]|nr:C40 family peptidase [Patescibacteria group bacterium]